MCAKAAFELLTESERKQVIDQSLTILEEQGVDVHMQEAIDILVQAGCSADGIRVKIPRAAVEKALELAPSSIDIYDRDGNPAMVLGDMNTYFGPGPTCPNYFDPKTGERRAARKEDAVTTALLSDALPNIDFVMSLCMIADRTKELADVHEIDAMVRNTTKPLAGWAFNGTNAQTIIDMCAVVAGGLKNLQDKPFLMIYCEPQTPFMHNPEGLSVLLTMAKSRIPVIYTPGMLMGGTTAVTVAGALSLGLCDCLVGLVIAETMNPGTPFISAANGGVMDMRTMQHSYGAPELTQLCSASVECFHTLGIPVFTAAGTVDAKVIDAQAGAEAMMQVIGALGTGGHLIHDVGFMDLGLTGSPQWLVACDEIIGYGRSFMAGIPVDEEHLAKDAIEEVGPAGNFITSMHTLEHYQELWTPQLFERRSYEEWRQDGSMSLADRAQLRMRKILATHKPEPLAPEIADALTEIVNKTEGSFVSALA